MENSHPKKIFISGINSQLGYHLTQTLRQDHLFLQNYPLITGTLAKPQQQFILHDSVHKTFDFCKNRDITVKNAVQSDVIVFDIRFTPAYEIQFILKVLKHYNVKKPLTVIGISNYMTWSNCKTTKFSTNPNDKESLLEYTLRQEHWQKCLLSPKRYKARVPHPLFAYNHQLQETIMDLSNHNKLIHPQILCTGVLVGKSGFDLKDYLESATNCNSKNNGGLFDLMKEKHFYQNHMLPFLNVQHLLERVQKIVNSHFSEMKGNRNNEAYQVISQERNQNIFKLIQEIFKLAGNTSLQSMVSKQVPLSIQRSTFGEPRKSNFSLDNNHGPGSNTLQIPQFQDQYAVSPRGISSNIISCTAAGTICPTAPILQILSKNNKKLISLMTRNLIFQKNNTQSKENSQQQTNPHAQRKSWIQSVYQDFLQFYQILFKRITLSQQLYTSLSQQNQKQLQQTLLFHYQAINKQKLTQITDLLTKQGLINQRLPTPEQQKKKIPPLKKNDSRESTRKQQYAYELFFPQVMKYVFKKYENKNYLILLKQELLVKILQLLKQEEFSQFSEIKFVILQTESYKQSCSSNPSLKIEENSANVQTQLQLFTEQYYQHFQIQLPKPIRISLEEQTFPQLPKSQKTRTELLPKTNPNQKSKQNKTLTSQNEQQVRINLISQFLLDNIVIYAAQAKQQLKLKGKLNIGQKFEGKQNIKLFIEELKKIRKRELTLISQQQEQARIIC